MAVTQVTQGSYTNTISYEAGDSLAAIRALVLAFITGHGWALHESTAGSDVFKSLDYGGTPGTDTHYSYAELDYSITDRVCLRQWLSWTAGVGIQKAQNLYGFSGGMTESGAGQPLSVTLGGSLIINVARGRMYVYSQFPGTSGNFLTAGSMIVERMRVHSVDSVGGNPACIFMHLGNLLVNGYMYYKWSSPKGMVGGSNIGDIAGEGAGFWFPGTNEFYPWYLTRNLGAPANNIDFIDGSTQASPVQLIVGLDSTNFRHARLGALQGVIRKYGAAAGDIITAPADALGIPTPGGTPTEYLVVPGGIGLVR